VVVDGGAVIFTFCEKMEKSKAGIEFKLKSKTQFVKGIYTYLSHFGRI
jgi:hypothetical protein